jgi:heterotetrameric sarcosine oxidase gamma subunit
MFARSGLEHVAVPGRYGALTEALGVVIAPRTELALATVMARAGKASELAHRAAAAFGIELPLTPRRVNAGTVSFVWAGPDQWLAAMEHVDGHVFERKLRRDFAGLASVVDQSDGRSIIRVGGPKARETLAKGIPLDLDPRAFRVNAAALTIAGHINVHFWQVDETPSYEFAVFRSFGVAFWEWLLEASAEFGAVVE